MKNLSAICLSSLLAFTGTPSLADETKDGLVICYGNGITINQVGKVAGAQLAYDDFRGQPNLYDISPAIFPFMFAEIPNGLRSGVIDGHIFYDRSVTLGSETEVGITGQAKLGRLGDSIGGCKFVMEMPTCAHQQNENWTVSCADPNAVEAEGEEGSNF